MPAKYKKRLGKKYNGRITLSNSFSLKVVDKNKLIITASWTTRLFRIIVYDVIFFFIFIGILCEFNFENVFNIKITESVSLIWWYKLFPFLILPHIIQVILDKINVERQIIDGKTKEITRNNKRIALFRNIKAIQIRIIPNFKGPDDFRLSLFMRDDKMITIKQSRDRDKISELADKMADIIKVDILGK